VIQRGRLFQLSHQTRAAGNQLFCLDQIFRTLNEGKRDPVHAQ
jgi:hypothetical protein